MSRKLLVGILTLVILASLPLGVFAEGNTPAATGTSQIEVLTLDQCLDLAYKNSQQLKATQKSVEIAQAAVTEAEAGLMPTLKYSYNDSYYFDQTLSGTGKNQSSNASLTLSQNLFTGGVVADTISLRKIALQSARETERKTKEQLTFNVKQSYYQCWVAVQMLTVAQNSLDNMNHHVDQMNGFFQVGTVAKYDLLKAQVQRDSLKPAVIKAQNGLALAKLGLATLIGKDKDQNFTVQIDAAQIQVPEKNMIDLNAALADANKNRSEIRQIQQTAEINKLNTDMAKAGYKPSVVLSATYGASRGADIIPESNKWGLNLSLLVTGTLYNGGATQAKVNQTKGAEELTTIQEAALHDQIRTEVEQSLQGITEGIETVKYNKANIDLAKEGLRMAQARFDAGMGTTMDIMDAQTALDQALNGYFSGLSNYLTAVAKLDMVVANDK